MLRFLIGCGKFKSNKCYKDAFIDMGGNAYQVKPKVKCTENSREPVTHEAFFSKLIWKSKQSVPDTFSLLMLFKRQCEKKHWSMRTAI